MMQRQSYPTENVLSNKITRNRIVLSFKDSARKPLRWQHDLGIDVTTEILTGSKVPIFASSFRA